MAHLTDDTRATLARSTQRSEPDAPNSNIVTERPALFSTDNDRDQPSNAGIHKLTEGNDRIGSHDLSQADNLQMVGGGYGFDTVMFDGNLSDYLIVRDHAITTVRAVSNPNDSTSWFNVEALEFADTTYTLEYDAPTDQIATIYDRLLARQADLEGFQYWASTNSQGAGIGSIALSILSSQEYADLSDSNFAALDPTAQVDVLYQALLGRQADADGKAYWLNALSDGATLDAVAAGFVLCAELSQHYVGPESWDFLV